MRYNIDEKKREAAIELRSRLDDMREAAEDEAGEEFDGVYGINIEPIVTITLAGGGPSAWIEYRPLSAEAEFHTTAPGYADGAGETVVPLRSDEDIAVIDAYVESCIVPTWR